MQRNNIQRLLPTLPDYRALQTGIATLEHDYKGVNPKRMELIRLLQAVDAYVQSQDGMSNDEKREVILAAYVFSLERIEAERWVGQGSSMREIIYSVLGVKDFSDIDNTSRLILMNQFGKFFATEAGQQFLIASEKLTSRVKSLQAELVVRLKPEIEQIRHALPIEANLDIQMVHIVKDYIASKKLPVEKLNQERLIAAQLLQVIAVSNLSQAEAEADLFSPTYRIKMGAILFIMREIGSANSKLYQHCQALLNIKHPDDIHPDLEKICLLATRNYLSGKDAAITLEKQGRVEFGRNNKLVNLELKLDTMIRSINVDVSVSASTLDKLSTLSLLLAGVGGVILAAPGYGAGQALGMTVAQTDLAVRPTQIVAGNMHLPIRFCLGGVGNYVGNFAATLVINKTLESAFGFAIGSLGFIVGAATGAMLGYTVFQVTPAIVKQICKLCLDMHSQITDPVLADKVDRRELEALMRLPDDVFTDEKKKEITYVTGVAGLSMFASPVPASSSLSATAQAAAAAAAADSKSLPSQLRQSNGG